MPLPSPMSTRSLRDWFTPHVAEADVFVQPDFNLGQFFYTAATARHLVDALDRYASPCCLCTPRLAAEWHARGRDVRLLEYDRRFATLPGFRHFDLLKPEPAADEFDAIVFDPIFVPAATLLRAVRAAAAGSPRADLFMTFPVERQPELLAAFSDFNLRPLDFPLACCNVKPEAQHLFRLYGTRPLEPPPGANAPSAR